MSSYQVTAEAFNQYFEEGLFESLEFYKSSTISQLEINDLIETNLYRNSNLSHQIERPQVTKIDLKMALSSLSQFSGKWHGNWEKMQVHHLWLPVRKFSQDLIAKATLMGFQSCFTGDGFGWNYVVKQSNQLMICGFVVHFDDDGSITSKNPHYAFVNNNNQLIWITKDHVYCEFICSHSGCSDKRHYVISGAGYKKQHGQLKLEDAFQTTYSSNDEGLPAFKNIKLNRMNF